MGGRGEGKEEDVKGGWEKEGGNGGGGLKEIRVACINAGFHQKNT